MHMTFRYVPLGVSFRIEMNIRRWIMIANLICSLIWFYPNSSKLTVIFFYNSTFWYLSQPFFPHQISFGWRIRHISLTFMLYYNSISRHAWQLSFVACRFSSLSIHASLTYDLNIWNFIMSQLFPRSHDSN